MSKSLNSAQNPFKTTKTDKCIPACFLASVSQQGDTEVQYKLLSQASDVTDLQAPLGMVHSSVKDLEFLSHTHSPVFLSALIFLILCEMQGHGKLPSPIFLSPFCNGSQLKSQSRLLVINQTNPGQIAL